MRTRLLVTFGIFVSFSWLFNTTRTASVTPPQAAVKPVNFNRDIRPIFSDTCFKCHGPDEKQRMANLRLDDTEGLFTDRGGYRIIVPGSSAQSKLYQKISSKDESMLMPPADSGRSLTPKQIEVFKTWIDQGAKWDMLWSFVPPKRPPVPDVKGKDWTRNPIDNFVLARLEAEGLKHSPEADKATLLRRVYFDLTGLPPTLAEIDAFVADKSSDAYEKRVDQLLASPHYGERMAMPWLDMARYADTHGYHIDSVRDMHAWRDWVINSFNQNLPYDEFTIEQIAGDLLPNATLDQKIASGFNRNHMITFEGGAIPAEYHVEYLVDRASTTSTAFLGLTMGCARCHDHKFDPITQKDFYRFFAFFNTVPERGLDGRMGNAAPFLPMPSHEQQQQLESLKTQIASTLAALPEKDLLAQRNEWQKTALASLPEPTHEGLTAYYAFDGDLTDASGFHHDAKAVRGEVVFDDGAVAKDGNFSPETQVSFGNSGDFDRNKPFSVSLWLMPPSSSAVKILTKHAVGEHWQGWEIADDKPISPGERKQMAHMVVRLAAHWPDNAIEVQTKERVQVNKQGASATNSLHHMIVEYDGSGKASGIKFYEDGEFVKSEVLKDHLSGSIRNTAALEIGDKALGTSYEGAIDDLRVYDRVLTSEEVDVLAIRLPARALLMSLNGRPTDELSTLKPDKTDAEDIQIGEEAKPQTKEEIAKAQEKDHQAKLSEYFLENASPEKERKHYAK